MSRNAPRTLSIDELSSLTGEPLERLQRLCSLGLLGNAGVDSFFADAPERVRLIEFLERRGFSIDTIAKAERDGELLTSVMDFLFPEGVGRTYRQEEAIAEAGLDICAGRAVCEAAGLVDGHFDDADVEMLKRARSALDAGFPQSALLQLFRVYSDALGRVAEAETRLFHFYVHEGLKASGLSGMQLLRTRHAVRDRLLPIAEPSLRYFHRKCMIKAVREDMVLHVAADTHPTPAGEPHAQLKLAIVFLDLSSFTLMADVMGDAAAANVVERFSELVRSTAARFEGRVVDRIGDAFLIVFSDPKAAVHCALEIEKSATCEPHFPAARGAVHWGDVLYQEGGYVGASLNLASRVATAALPHQILITADVRSAIGTSTGIRVMPLGKRSFKGIAKPIEVFHISAATDPVANRVRDPVCGMEMAQDEVAARLAVADRVLAFCSEKCLRTFLDAPHQYGGSS